MKWEIIIITFLFVYAAYLWIKRWKKIKYDAKIKELKDNIFDIDKYEIAFFNTFPKCKLPPKFIFDGNTTMWFNAHPSYFRWKSGEYGSMTVKEWRSILLSRIKLNNYSTKL